MITLFVILPLVAAFLAILLSHFKKLPTIIANLTSYFLFALSIYLLKKVPIIYGVGGWKIVGNIPIGIYLVYDGLSAFILLILNLVSAIVLIYSIKYIELYTAKPKFYCLFMLMLAGMNGVVLSGDLFNLFVFMEIAAISSYALVAFGTESEELEAGFKYQVMGSVASAFILLAIALLYSFTGTLNLADMGIILKGSFPNLVALVALCLFLAGFGLKAGIVPFHAWLPDAHPSAPAAVSAMLSGLLIKAIGIYPIIRIFYSVYDFKDNILFNNTMLWLGLISMTVAGLLAFAQRDLKRMLAYSSVSQMGYIVFALGLANTWAILGALLHIFNHAIAKALLFLNSGNLIYTTSERDMYKLGGLRKSLPFVYSSTLIGALSIAGIPPLVGFWSKLLIVLGAISKGYYFMACWIVAISILTLSYYLHMQKLVFYGEEKIKPQRKVPFSMSLAVGILLLIAIIGGVLLLPKFFYIISEAQEQIMKGGNIYQEIVLGGRK